MNYFCWKYIYDYYKETKGNFVSHALYHEANQSNPFVDMGRFLEFLSEEYYRKEKNHVPIVNPKEKKYFSDYRIKGVRLKNFKKYGSITHNDREMGYEISFTDRTDMPISTVIIGDNSSGKTSVFSAIEYVFTNNVGIANHRKIDLKEFITHGNLTTDDIAVSVGINDKKGDGVVWENNLANQLFSFRPFFVNDLDFFEIENYDDVKEYVTEALQRDELRNMVGLLSSIYEQWQKHNDVERVAIGSFHYLNLDILLSDLYIIASDKNYSTIFAGLHALRNSLKEQVDSEIMSLDLNRDGEMRDSDIKKLTKGLFTVFNESSGKWLDIKTLEFYGKSNYFTAIQKTIEIIKNNYKAMTDDFQPEDDYGWGEASEYSIDLYGFISELEFYLKELLMFEDYMRDKEGDQTSRISLSKRQRYAMDMSQTYIKELEEYSDRETRNLLKNVTLDDGMMGEVGNALEFFKKKMEAENIIIEECFMKLLPEIINSFSEDTDDKLEYDSYDRFLVSNPAILGDKKMPPKAYYNNFRNKLYCFSIKMALSIITMKLYEIKAPIVIDDIFSSSDFDNSKMINKLFSKLTDEYQRQTGGRANELQYIIFTHDEVIGNSLCELGEFPFSQNRIQIYRLLDPLLFSEKDMLDDVTSNDVNLCLKLFDYEE